MDSPNALPSQQVAEAIPEKVPTGFRIVAAIEFLSGAFLLGGFLLTLGKPSNIPSQLLPPFYSLLTTFSLAIAAASLVAAVLLWLGRYDGFIATIVIQCLQIPQYGYRISGNQSAVQFGVNFIPIILLVVLAHAAKSKLPPPPTQPVGESTPLP